MLTVMPYNTSKDNSAGSQGCQRSAGKDASLATTMCCSAVNGLTPARLGQGCQRRGKDTSRMPAVVPVEKKEKPVQLRQ